MGRAIHRKRIKRPLAFLSLLLVLILLLLQRGKHAGNELLLPWEEQLDDGRSVQAYGTLKDMELKGERLVFYLQDTFIEAGKEVLPLNNLTAYQETDADLSINSYQIGNILKVNGTLKIPEGAANPGQFDARFYYQVRKMDYLIFQAETEVVSDIVRPVQDQLWRIRRALSESLYRNMEEAEASVLESVLLGQKANLDNERKQLYQKSGIAHILAISGLHISFLGRGCYRLLRKAGCPLYGAAAISSVGILLYGVMIGYPVSAFRAIVMFLCAMLAEILGRTYDRISALALAAVISLLRSPLYLFDAGFLLSFGAVLGLELLRPLKAGDLQGTENRLLKGIIGGLSITLGTLPVQLWFFYEFSPWGLLLNLAVIPLAGLLLAFGLAGAVAGLWLSVPAQLLLGPCYVILKCYDILCKIAERLPFYQVITGRPQLIQIILYYLLLFICLSGVLHKRKEKQGQEPQTGISHAVLPRAGALGTMLGILAALLILLWRRDVYRITFLDVGQGDCAVLELGAKVYLIDGGSTSVSQVGEYRILPYLKYRGISEVEAVFITHEHEDHYNGILELLEKGGLSPELLYLPVLSREDTAAESGLAKAIQQLGGSAAYLEAGMQMAASRYTISCLHPDNKFRTDNENDRSIVLHLQCDGVTVLFMGDLEAAGEMRLQEGETPLQQVMLLKVGHHGSDTSSTESFLQQAAPLEAVISCALKNFYGHPKQEIVDRLEDMGIQVHFTMRSGAVFVEIEKGTYEITSYLKNRNN